MFGARDGVAGSMREDRRVTTESDPDVVLVTSSVLMRLLSLV